MNSTDMQPWTGRTIFIVDQFHTDRWGTDQRRQRIEAANLKSEKVFDLLDEEVHSTKPRWAELSMNDHELEEHYEYCQKRPGAEKTPEKPGV